MKPIVAIVGRPNVGKSTLFNRLIQSRVAIIEDEPGITRDRIYSDTDWHGRTFTLVDTGGVMIGPEGTIEEQVRKQAELAMAEADLIVFVVDGQAGLLAGDAEVADLLRRVEKPVLLAVNKVEHLKHEDLAHEFYALGLGDPITVSAIHGMGTGDLLDAVVEGLPEAPPYEEEEDDPNLIRVAVIGRPNVGKSSLVNALLGEERVVVSDVAGTTRDAIDILVEQEGDRFLLIDTAGIRRSGRIERGVEKYSVLRALRAIERADVVLVVVDAAQGVTDQDQKVAGYAVQQGKGCVVVVNKWDLIEKDDKTMREYEEKVRDRLAFMSWAHLAFLSAKTHSRVVRLLPIVKEAFLAYGRRVNTATLNDVVREAVLLNPPPSDKGRHLKIYYATQAESRPPLFIFSCNDPLLVHFSYRRYLENRIREVFDFAGTPIRLVFRRRESQKQGK